MSRVALRRARADDIEAIVALLADDDLGATREVVSTPPAAVYLEAFQAIAREEHQLLAVADRDDAVIGCLQISFIPGLSRQGAWRGQIEGVRIAATARGAGIGADFIAWAIERCRERGCKLVQLTTHHSRTDAQRFYQGLGFEASHIGMKREL